MFNATMTFQQVAAVNAWAMAFGTAMGIWYPANPAQAVDEMEFADRIATVARCHSVAV